MGVYLGYPLPDEAPVPTPNPGNVFTGAQPQQQQPEGFAGFLQSPGFGNILQAMGASLMSSPRNAPLSNFGQFLPQFQRQSMMEQEQRRALQKDQEAKDKENKTLQYLRENFPEIAARVDAGLPISEAFQYALTLEKAALKGESGTEYGLNPQYGIDENGNPVLIQIGKDGTSVKTPLPDGVSLSKEPIKLDAGTHFVLLDPITRQQIGIIPKENYQEAFDSSRGGEDGKTAAAAGAALPGARDMAALINDQVTSLKEDPYLENMLGMVNSRLPNLSEDSARVQSKIDQISGGAFLQARQMLKGGGAITDFESAKAEQAFIRMNTAQKASDFRAALDEFNQAVQDGVRKLEAQVGRRAGTFQGGSAPSGGGGTTSGGVQWSIEP